MSLDNTTLNQNTQYVQLNTNSDTKSIRTQISLLSEEYTNKIITDHLIPIFCKFMDDRITEQNFTPPTKEEVIKYMDIRTSILSMPVYNTAVSGGAFSNGQVPQYAPRPKTSKGPLSAEEILMYTQIVNETWDDRWSLEGCQRYIPSGANAHKFCGSQANGKFLCSGCAVMKSTSSLWKSFNETKDLDSLKHRKNKIDARLKIAKEKLGSSYSPENNNSNTNLNLKTATQNTEIQNKELQGFVYIGDNEEGKTNLIWLNLNGLDGCVISRSTEELVGIALRHNLAMVEPTVEQKEKYLQFLSSKQNKEPEIESNFVPSSLANRGAQPHPPISRPDTILRPPIVNKPPAPPGFISPPQNTFKNNIPTDVGNSPVYPNDIK